MACPQCGADTQSGARFCDQCGTRLPPYAQGGTVAAAAMTAAAVPEPASSESVIDEVVDSMAQEPGTRKGPVLWITLAILLLLLLAGLWWAFKGGSGSSADAPLVGEAAPATGNGPMKAPTLADQMGNGVPPSSSTDAAVPAAKRTVAVPPMPVTRETSPKPARVPPRPTAEERVRSAEAVRAEKSAATETREAQVAEGAPALSTAQQVAVCEKMSVFARQPCLWRACNHKWGKDGCPSYD